MGSSPKFKVYQTNFGWGKLEKSEVVHKDKARVISLAEGRDEEDGVGVGLVLPKDQIYHLNVILNKFLEMM